jgi:hypothetical protein
LNDKLQNEDENENPYEDFDDWKGTELAKFLNSPKKLQTINKIEPGGFRYVTVPNSWAEGGLQYNSLIFISFVLACLRSLHVGPRLQGIWPICDCLS